MGSVETSNVSNRNGANAPSPLLDDGSGEAPLEHLSHPLISICQQCEGAIALVLFGERHRCGMAIPGPTALTQGNSTALPFSADIKHIAAKSGMYPSQSGHYRRPPVSTLPRYNRPMPDAKRVRMRIDEDILRAEFLLRAAGSLFPPISFKDQRDKSASSTQISPMSQTAPRGNSSRVQRRFNLCTPVAPWMLSR